MLPNILFFRSYNTLLKCKKNKNQHTDAPVSFVNPNFEQLPIFHPLPISFARVSLFSVRFCDFVN